jgi:SAM-dependent methyltransferase
MFAVPAAILRKPRVQQLLAERPNGTVVEFGAGCLRNSIYLLDAGFKVTALDLPGIQNRFREQYRRFTARGGKVMLGAFPKGRQFDFAVCTFVIETICQPTLRLRFLSSIRLLLRQNGFLLLSTRGPADVVTAHARGIRCSDGFLTPNRTFVRSFDVQQIIRLLRSAGFGSIDVLHKSGTRAPELVHVIAFRR